MNMKTSKRDGAALHMGAIHRIVTPQPRSFFKPCAANALFAPRYGAIAVVWKGSKMKIGRLL
jgi:glycogen synthase